MRTRWIGMAAAVAFVLAACGGTEEQDPSSAQVGKQEQASVDEQGNPGIEWYAECSPLAEWMQYGNTITYNDCKGWSEATRVSYCRDVFHYYAENHCTYIGCNAYPYYSYTQTRCLNQAKPLGCRARCYEWV